MIKGTRPDILIVDDIAHNHEVSSPSARAMLKAMRDSLIFGTGTIRVPDSTDIEDRVTSVNILKQREEQDRIVWPNEFTYIHGRRGGKNWINNWYSKLLNMPYETVKANLDELQGTQQLSIEGHDPLFEAMELHNARVSAGKRAIRGMFEATPLPNFIERTQGPLKAKDWEK